MKRLYYLFFIVCLWNDNLTFLAATRFPDPGLYSFATLPYLLFSPTELSRQEGLVKELMDIHIENGYFYIWLSQLHEQTFHEIQESLDFFQGPPPTPCNVLFLNLIFSPGASVLLEKSRELDCRKNQIQKKFDTCLKKINPFTLDDLSEITQSCLTGKILELYFLSEFNSGLDGQHLSHTKIEEVCLEKMSSFRIRGFDTSLKIALQNLAQPLDFVAQKLIFESCALINKIFKKCPHRQNLASITLDERFRIIYDLKLLIKRFPSTLEENDDISPPVNVFNKRTLLGCVQLDALQNSQDLLYQDMKKLCLYKIILNNLLTGFMLHQSLHDKRPPHPSPPYVAHISSFLRGPSEPSQPHASKVLTYRSTDPSKGCHKEAAALCEQTTTLDPSVRTLMDIHIENSGFYTFWDDFRSHNFFYAHHNIALINKTPLTNAQSRKSLNKRKYCSYCSISSGFWHDSDFCEKLSNYCSLEKDRHEKFLTIDLLKNFEIITFELSEKLKSDTLTYLLPFYFLDRFNCLLDSQKLTGETLKNVLMITVNDFIQHHHKAQFKLVFCCLPKPSSFLMSKLDLESYILICHAERVFASHEISREDGISLLEEALSLYHRLPQNSVKDILHKDSYLSALFPQSIFANKEQFDAFHKACDLFQKDILHLLRYKSVLQDCIRHLEIFTNRHETINDDTRSGIVTAHSTNRSAHRRVFYPRPLSTDTPPEQSTDENLSEGPIPITSQQPLNNSFETPQPSNHPLQELLASEITSPDLEEELTLFSETPQPSNHPLQELLASEITSPDLEEELTLSEKSGTPKKNNSVKISNKSLVWKVLRLESKLNDDLNTSPILWSSDHFSLIDALFCLPSQPHIMLPSHLAPSFSVQSCYTRSGSQSTLCVVKSQNFLPDAAMYNPKDLLKKLMKILSPRHKAFGRKYKDTFFQEHAPHSERLDIRDEDPVIHFLRYPKPWMSIICNFSIRGGVK